MIYQLAHFYFSLYLFLTTWVCVKVLRFDWQCGLPLVGSWFTAVWCLVVWCYSIRWTLCRVVWIWQQVPWTAFPVLQCWHWGVCSLCLVVSSWHRADCSLVPGFLVSVLHPIELIGGCLEFCSLIGVARLLKIIVPMTESLWIVAWLWVMWMTEMVPLSWILMDGNCFRLPWSWYYRN